MKTTLRCVLRQVGLQISLQLELPPYPTHTPCQTPCRIPDRLKPQPNHQPPNHSLKIPPVPVSQLEPGNQPWVPMLHNEVTVLCSQVSPQQGPPHPLYTMVKTVSRANFAEQRRETSDTRILGGRERAELVTKKPVASSQCYQEGCSSQILRFRATGISNVSFEYKAGNSPLRPTS